MPGPLPTDPGRRVRRNTPPATLVLPAIAPADRPAPPDGLSDEIVEQWAAFWDSPLANLVADTDLPALRRLFEQRERACQLNALAMAEPLVVGSQGQLVVNPLFAKAETTERAVRDLEDRFGLNLKARLAMGVTVGQVADAAKRHPEVFGSQEKPTRADPRLADPRPAAPEPRGGSGGLDGGEPRPRRR